LSEQIEAPVNWGQAEIPEPVNLPRLLRLSGKRRGEKACTHDLEEPASVQHGGLISLM
jgi:hypothetical protein